MYGLIVVIALVVFCCPAAIALVAAALKVICYAVVVALVERIDCRYGSVERLDCRYSPCRDF